MARFKKLTEGDGFNAVIMWEEKTLDSLPEAYRPLPERLNIVIRPETPDGKQMERETALYIGRAIEIAYADGCDECLDYYGLRFTKCSRIE